VIGLQVVIYDIEFSSAAQVPTEGILEAAKLAEVMGFGTLWKGEVNNRDPTVVLSAVAAVTKRIRLGTAVLHIFARTPVETGIMAATLDELSGGRFALGLGVANKTLASWHGLEMDHPLKRMEEYVTIVRKVYGAQRVKVSGDHYSSDGFKLEFKPPRERLPILLASLGPRMARLAGRICEGVLTNMANPSRIGFIRSNLEAGAREVGRNPWDLEVVAKVCVSVNDDIEKAKASLKRVAAYYCLAARYGDIFTELGLAKEVEKVKENYKTFGFKLAAHNIADETLSSLPMVAATTTGDVRNELRTYDESGADRVVVVYLPSTEQSTAEIVEFVKSWQ
jgi:alkanesulfonate monooxygenase SsuD/methylene tetrahydromethanopterin reductase-like flavin-dependent oxidoreductase (luciferase family)